MPTHVVVFYSLLATAVSTAFLIGGRPEKQVAGMLLAATCFSKLVAWQPLAHFANFEPALFATDVLLLVGLGRVALRSDRYWPIWLTALHAYSVIAHVARALNTDTNVTVYLANSAMTADPGLVLLTVGSWRHWRRRSQMS
ncbi:hypothetical protein M0208_06275 [Sphingomonas sp. SUN019]|uniref:hypothetical protein n=1 Tax=Sphingomonas sp. SUN019 TaxID=2937788 RepID=UPI002164B108|nr:hypothetical protein [Sphingomonas sp. SUN019]UVO50143.1 hypothetical protein M0208_06275 [Sphingomonas sp. SUN019]